MSLRKGSRLDVKAISAEFIEYDVDRLEQILEIANYQYWDKDSAQLPDTLYDRLVERLRSIQPDAPILQKFFGREPLDRLGLTVRHQRPMLSLAKCYEAKQLLDWVDKFTGAVLVMPKIDGVACSLRYQHDGRLKLAATRGTGEEGEDITANILEIAAIPKRLKVSKNPNPQADESTSAREEIEVRGEVYMRKSVFHQYAEEFSHPRNLTAGVLKNKERGRCASFELSFYAYDLDGTSHRFEGEKMARLRSFGFDSQPYEICEREQLLGKVSEFDQLREQLDFEIDGIVFRADDSEEYQRLGLTGHHPRAAIAYKFQGDTGETEINDVLWSVSRTGTITPVAMFSPILLSGAMLSRASLHNLNRFEELKLHKNCRIEVTRRGGVIPMVERVVAEGDRSQPFLPPEVCPACGSIVERRRKRDGEFLVCGQPDQCIHARLGELEHFAKVVDLQGFGPKVISQTVDQGLLNNPADFYRLKISDLQVLDRLAIKSAQNLIDQIELHREIPLAVFLQALGIDHLGKQNALLLASTFNNLERILDLDLETLIEIKGVKEAIAEAIVRGLASKRSHIEGLLAEVQVTPHVENGEKDEDESGALGGKTFLFTGTLSSFDRKKAEEMVRALGGGIATTVSKKLDYLVVGGARAKLSSKQVKAQKLIEEGGKLQILEEKIFFEMLTSYGVNIDCD